MTLPLDGITILDLTRQYPGPYCTMILADLGANIIRVEDPRYPLGNPPPFFQKGRIRESAFNAILNRNKRSITLNFKKEKAKEIFFELVKEADVVIDTYRPKVMQKLGIDYDTLSAINPHIICCSLSGYGQYGPYEQLAGHDLNYIGICGILDLNRDREILGQEDKDRKPIVPGLQSADVGGGLVTTIGILGALIERENNPEKRGQYIDISMTDCVFSFMTMTAAYHISENCCDGIRNQNLLHGDFPFYSVYKTKDNKYVAVGNIEPQFWRGLCEGLGREDLKLKQTLPGEGREWVFQELEKEFLKKTQAEWFEIFNNYDTCVTPVKSFSEACEDPQIKARNMVVTLDHPKFGKVQNIASPIKYSRTPLSIRNLAPKTGQHTKEFLKSMNYSDEEIKQLKRGGVI